MFKRIEGHVKFKVDIGMSSLKKEIKENEKYIEDNSYKFITELDISEPKYFV